MPHALKFPWMWRAIVPLVGIAIAVVLELVADRFPRLSPIVRALDKLTEPPARLRCIETVRIDRGAFHVINFPSAEVRAAYLPPIAFPIRGKDECAFSGSHQSSDFAHSISPYSQLIIQGVPKRSRNIAKRFAQKVGCSGIDIEPRSDKAA
jgi:hypothetical protein